MTRPVAPVAILAAELDELVATVSDAADPQWQQRLGRARDLAGGLDPYVERCTSPASPALQALDADTRGTPWSGTLEAEMLSGHVEGQLLRLLVRACGARRVLEVGTFTGYAALAMAEAVPDDGQVVTCEVDAGVATVARRGFDRTPVGARIDLRVGPAADTLRELAGRQFDLVFLDADKAGYLGYLELVLDLDLLAPRGLVCVDNTLMQGEPWTDGWGRASGNGRAIAEFNRAVADDPRLEQVLVPLRDGLTLAMLTPTPGES